MTECNQSEFEFQAHFSRRVVAAFDGGAMTSDAGGLLLRQTDRRLNLVARLAACFLDGRDPRLVRHSVTELIAQRVYGLALGYEDVNDHDQLRQDPLLRVLAGKADVDQPLAGKSTLNRLELSEGTPDRYKKITYWKAAIDELLVDLFLESLAEAPPEIVLDLDTTDLDPRLKTAQIDSVRADLALLQSEIVEFERLRHGAVRSFDTDSLADLPRLLIQARIGDRLRRRQL